MFMPITLSLNRPDLEPGVQTRIRYARAMVNPALKAVMLGAGNRGFDAYGNWALVHPERLKFVGIADSDPAKLERFGIAHDIPPEHRFSNWKELLTAKLAPAAFIALPDQLHETAAIATLEAGYHLLLEKPVASTLEGTLRVARAAEQSGKVVMLGYVSCAPGNSEKSSHWNGARTSRAST
jgi:predicted dehydrogenase